MNEKARKYIDLFRKVKIVSAATVDDKGRPQNRIINVMLSTDEGMYIVASKGKPFYKQLEKRGEVALSAMCPDVQSLKFYGKVKKAAKEWLDEVFIHNPGLNEVYPGDTRYILDAFLIYEGYGEWFDLAHYPINRELFSYGVEAEKAGFEISKDCIGCGKCLEKCPQKSIKEGNPYEIQWSHCLQCGACYEICPVNAVKELK